MTDFYGQLERQLVEAGRRHAERGRWRMTLAGRGRPLLALATVLLAVVAAAVFGVSALRSGSSPDPGNGAAPSTPPATPPAGAPPPADPPPSSSLRGVTVAVFNGTTTAGLGRSVGELLERRGATIVATNTWADQTVARTAVQYAPGAGAKALRVARVLGIAGPRDFRSRSAVAARAAPDAMVLVIAGSDRTP